jgi:hypothetical protein
LWSIGLRSRAPRNLSSAALKLPLGSESPLAFADNISLTMQQDGGPRAERHLRQCFGGCTRLQPGSRHHSLFPISIGLGYRYFAEAFWEIRVTTSVTRCILTVGITSHLFDLYMIHDAMDTSKKYFGMLLHKNQGNESKIYVTLPKRSRWKNRR